VSGTDTRPQTEGYSELLDALTLLRDRLAEARLPLEVPEVEAARSARKRLVDQLDDYVLPRLRRLDAPLLVVVGGSTGAGKSTLVNSLVGADVSRSGVLRPTTRGPVLVHHPQDAPWFIERRLLPGLARVTGEAADPGGLLLVASGNVPSGLALLDAPDVDSVVTANRELAAQLLGAADLWLFLTTAARYADAVPWDLLREASERSAAVAIVLDRVPTEAIDEVRAHLAQMLRDEGLGESPLFVVPETTLVQGRLPDSAVAMLRTWLTGLAADAPARAAVVRATLRGVLGSYSVRVPALAEALAAQEHARTQLRSEAERSYTLAGAAVDEAMRDGSLLRGEVLARWQDVVGTGDLLRGLQTRVGQLRDRFVAAATGRRPPTEELAVALESGVEALVHAEADRAAERTVTAWRGEPAGRVLLAAAPPGLDRSSATLPDRTARAVRDWQGAVLELVRREGAGKRRTSQFLAYGVNGVALAVMVVVFASTGGLTGGEVVVAGGASALSQKLLEALLGDQAVRELAAKARVDLRGRVEALLAEEQERFTGLLAAADLGEVGAREVREAARTVATALDRVP
jgi:energy-coupling factor transporter ATP-binding protein EcfA2